MLKRKVGVDIVQEIGGIKTGDEANRVFQETMDETHLRRIQTIKTEEVLVKIANAISICEPSRVFVDTGSEADVQWIRNYSLVKGEERALPK